MSEKFFAVVNDLIGGYDVSMWNKPVSMHAVGEPTVGTFLDKEWAEQVARALNAEILTPPDVLKRVQ